MRLSKNSKVKNTANDVDVVAADLLIRKQDACRKVLAGEQLPQ